MFVGKTHLFVFRFVFISLIYSIKILASFAPSTDSSHVSYYLCSYTYKKLQPDCVFGAFRCVLYIRSSQIYKHGDFMIIINQQISKKNGT